MTKQRAIHAFNAVLVVGIALLAYHLASQDASGGAAVPPGPSSEFVRGDANDDGGVDIADPIALLFFLFHGDDAPPCLSAADTDDSGALDVTDAIASLDFLFTGGPPPALPFPEPGIDPTIDLGCRSRPLPEVNSLGGPDRELTSEEATSWLRGRDLFDRPTKVSEGLGPLFNGDSCRGCHLDPVIGGAGGLDVDVVRFAHVDEFGVVTQLASGPAASRLSIHGTPRDEAHTDANVVETRQTPTVFGLGLVDRIPDANIIANADPDDLDGDGISGRVRMVNDRVGRFGHKCGVPRMVDFAADASLNELGLTVAAENSPFAGPTDSDGVNDPELTNEQFADLVFYCAHIAPPRRKLPEDPVARQRVNDGEQLFALAGCIACHRPETEGADGPVRAYSDFLLHDIADPSRHYVNEPGVAPAEFRTAPLWGVRDTAPYLHDGSAETIHEAVIKGHHGEAAPTRQRFEALSLDARTKIVEFVLSL